MIKISKKSWHYRLYRFAKEDAKGNYQEPSTLCGYLRSVLAGGFLFGILSLGLLLVAASLSTAVIGWVKDGTVSFGKLKEPIVSHLDFLETAGQAIFAVGMILGVILAVIYSLVVLRRKVQGFRPASSSFVSLLLVRLRSIHEKTCPRVEITE